MHIKVFGKKLIYVTIFSLAWAFLILVNKLALNYSVSPIPYTIHTTAVSVFLLTVYILLRQREELENIDLKVFKRLVLIGVFVGSAYVAGIYGLGLSTSINYSFLIKSTLVFTILLAFFFLGESLDKNKVTLMLTFVIGAYFITTGGVVIIPRIGDLLTILAAFCFSSALILQKPLVETLSPYIVGWGRVLFALATVLLLSPLFRATVSVISAPLYVLFSGILGAILVVYLNKTISVSSASYLTMMSMIVPVLNTVLGRLFLNETLNIFQVIGGGLIVLSGIFVHRWEI